MTRRAPPDPALAFVRACVLDVAVRKPGNVSADSPGHGMDAKLFLDSADAASVGLFRRGARVGERIEAAVTATLAVAGCNTNLGIVLLCAPLARALERCPTPHDALELRRTLRGVLDELDVDDARHAFRAIAAARPGGLGRAPAGDVSEVPQMSLLEAMRLAADRDRIAAQYASGFDDLFVTGLSSLQASPPTSVPPEGPPTIATVQRLYLSFLAGGLDSHIVRKFGAATAQAVTGEARPWLVRALAGEPIDTMPAFAAWDASLKARGLNPGTSADLTVATLFIAGALGTGLSAGVS